MNTTNTNDPIVGTIVRIQKNGKRYQAIDTDGRDLTHMLESYQMGNAFKANNALKAYQAANGIQWRKTSIAEFDNLAKSKAANRISDTSAGMTQAEIVNFIASSSALKPSTYKISDQKWKFAIRTVLRGKNMLITGLQGSGKTVLAFVLAEVLNRPLFNIPLGSTQDPRSVIIGNTHFKEGVGTFVATSHFVNAIQTPNAIILLDELSRAHTDAWNLLMPVLDYKQRFLRVDESPDTPTIKVAPGVTFIATANVGHRFTATRILDIALEDRFTQIEVEPLELQEESDLLTEMFPNVDKIFISSMCCIAQDIRKNFKSSDPRVTNIVSTRTTIEGTHLFADGFTFDEVMDLVVYPIFSDAGGSESERTFVKSIVQKYRPTKFDEVSSPFSIGGGNDDFTLPWA